MASILIYGTGGIGAMTAYVLSRTIAQDKIFAVCRSNYEAVKSSGLRINSTIWGDGLVVRPSVVKTVQEAVDQNGSAFDYVVVSTKSFPWVDQGQHPIAPAVSPTTAIALLQNGIGIEEAFRQTFPDNPIISAVIYCPVTQTAPGTFTQTLSYRIYLGTYPSVAPESHQKATQVFSDLLAEGGATTFNENDVQYERWRKLLINAAANPTCALARLPDVQFMKISLGAAKLMRDVMSEVALVAQAAGYPTINEELVQKQYDYMLAKPMPGVEPSMMADALAGRSMEADAILGNTIAIAQTHGIATPIMNIMYHLISGLNESFQR
jgi:2-dehydropantoate 2-reductase